MNFHISVLHLMEKDQSFGRHSVSCKHMLSLIVLNSAVTSATDPNSNTWQGSSCKSIFETNVQKFSLCAKFVTRSMLEPTSQVISALRIFTSRNWSKMSTTSSKTSLTNWSYIGDKKKVLDCAPNTSVLKNTETTQTNIRKAWSHKILKIVHLSVSGAKLLWRPMKTVTSAFTAMKRTAHHVSAIASSTTWKKWSSFFLSEVRFI